MPFVSHSKHFDFLSLIDGNKWVIENTFIENKN